MTDKLPYRRQHLRRLEKVSSRIKRLIYFVTACTLDRKGVLTREDAFERIVSTLHEAARRESWLVGRFVVMPDHIHFFCAPESETADLSKFMKRFKSLSTRRIWELGHGPRIWQKEFFDHLLRSDESYEAKWEYVRHNPVRHGLCENPEQWKYQGEIDVL